MMTAAAEKKFTQEIGKNLLSREGNARKRYRVPTPPIANEYRSEDGVV